MNSFVNFWERNGIPLTWQPKSKTTTWFSTDSEENFKKVKNNVFTAESFDYNFNQFGYRIGESDWQLNTKKKRVMTLGCSHTVGVGVPWSKSWPVLFSEEINGELFNLSVAGSSADTVFRTLHHSIDIIKPDVVAIFWPNPIRWEIYQAVLTDTDGIDCITPLGKSIWNADVNLINEHHLINLRIKNMELVKLLQKLHNFELISLDSVSIIEQHLTENKTTIEQYWNEFGELLNPCSFDSRDSLHPGITMHEYLKQKFIDRYSEICYNN